MSNVEGCDFCDKPSLEWRTIRSNDLFISFVSNPWFRQGHCLVVPTRHITAVHELEAEEGSAIMSELGRLSFLLDNGFGSGIMQKYQPLQAENGDKMNHLHYHVFPRQQTEERLFPVPSPNTFDGFTNPPEQEIVALAARLR